MQFRILVCKPSYQRFQSNVNYWTSTLVQSTIGTTYVSLPPNKKRLQKMCNLNLYDSYYVNTYVCFDQNELYSKLKITSESNIP